MIHSPNHACEGNSEHYCRKCNDYICYGLCYPCIDKYCFTKKKVREAIEKHRYPIMFETTMDENGIKKSVPIEFRVDINVLLKELGLEKEEK